MVNGIFSAGYSDEYYCTPAPGNKCTNTVFPAAASFVMPTPGLHTARVFLNFDRGAAEPDSAFPPGSQNNRRAINYTIIADTTYTISGNVFNDTNNNNLKDAGETNYTTGTSVIRYTPVGGATTTTAWNDGAFTLSNLRQGQYTVTLDPIPDGTIWPFLRQFSVTVGPSGVCAVADPSTGGRCDPSGNGNIIDLNFALQRSAPWIQSTGLDMRFDMGYPYKIPLGASCQSFASVNGSGNMPGVVITGSNFSDFGDGDASSENWVVGNTQFSEDFANPNSLSSSHSNLKSTIEKNIKAQITPLNDAINGIASCANYGSCVLTPSSLAPSSSMAYSVSGSDLTINSGVINGTKSIVVLVDGDVLLNGPISVERGSFLLISATGDIIVNQTVGATPDCRADYTPQIQGIYVTDRDFIVDGLGTSACNSPTPDTMLTIGGSVIVNAGNVPGGGELKNLRSLCTNNLNFPSIKVQERPDFFLNSPTLLQSQSVSWREVAP